MKEIRWSKLKSERLKLVRGVSFEEILASEFVTFQKHPKRALQNFMLFYYKDYIWMVPYVEDADHIFLKTLYPSRKYTKKYRRGELI